MPTSKEVVEFLDRVERTIDRARFPMFEDDNPSEEQIATELAALGKDASKLASSIRLSQTFSLEKLAGRVAPAAETNADAASADRKPMPRVDETVADALDSALTAIHGLPKGWTGLM